MAPASPQFSKLWTKCGGLWTVAQMLELFSEDCRTRWSTSSRQVFEVNFLYGLAEYQYRLEINLDSSLNRVEKETLEREGAVTLETTWQQFAQEEMLAFEDEVEFSNELHMSERRVVKFGHTDGMVGCGQNQSVLTHWGLALAQTLQGLHIFKINPPLMTSQIRKAVKRPTSNLADFSSYYLYMLQQKQGQIFDLLPHLREVIANFDSFAVSSDFEEARRNLQINCRRNTHNGAAKSSLRYSFDELSDGQRALIGLYTLLFCTLEPDATLVIDEPENYIALRELQPVVDAFARAT